MSKLKKSLMPRFVSASRTAKMKWPVLSKS